MKPPPLVLVTDPRWPLARVIEVVRAAGEALGPGGLAVQLRDRSSAAPAVLEAARALRAVTREVGALFVVNLGVPRALEAAVAVEADGLHLPGGAARARWGEEVGRARAALGASVFVSVAAHTDDDVRRAASAGARAVLVSPVFDTPGKGTARGPEALRAARRLVEQGGSGGDALAVYALGGVDTSTVEACRAAGADGVAVIRALLDAEDPRARARALAAHFAGQAAAVARRGNEC